MNTPHKCPICNGKGEIGKNKAKHDAVPVYSAIKNGRKIQVFTCHGCLGMGLIWQWKLQPEIAPPIKPYPFKQPYQQPGQIVWEESDNDYRPYTTGGDPWTINSDGTFRLGGGTLNDEEITS